MEYTYSAYRGLIRNLKDHGYIPIRFCDVSEGIELPAIIRHDVDMDLQKAVDMAMLEKEEDIKATYFVMISSEYYNLLAGNNLKNAQRILDLGHEIGLHFDLTAYDKNLSFKDLEKSLQKEIELLEYILDIKVKSISWHIPRQDLLNTHLGFLDKLGVWNAYDPLFYSGYKYVSDSMMRWREPIEEYIEQKKYNKLQILTHPIWYRSIQDMADEEILNENRDLKWKSLRQYLNTIKPGYSSTNMFSVK